MTEKIYLSPIASKTVDAKLQAILDALDMPLSEEDDLDVRSVADRNDLNLESTGDAPYA